tara:strand:+ start:1234 stop:1653 length:420 start_codon:yes stop_codon:yes gene_type:complete
MNKELLTYQTYESPSNTGRVIAGVSIITVGLAILIIYLVKESRKPDEQAYEELKNDPTSPYYVAPAPSQTQATTVGGLLDELFAFGQPPKAPNTVVQKTGCTISVACNYDPTANILDASMCDFESCNQPNLPPPVARYE